MVSTAAASKAMMRCGGRSMTTVLPLPSVILMGKPGGYEGVGVGVAAGLGVGVGVAVGAGVDVAVGLGVGVGVGGGTGVGVAVGVAEGVALGLRVAVGVGKGVGVGTRVAVGAMVGVGVLVGGGVGVGVGLAEQARASSSPSAATRGRMYLRVTMVCPPFRVREGGRLVPMRHNKKPRSGEEQGLAFNRTCLRLSSKAMTLAEAVVLACPDVNGDVQLRDSAGISPDFSFHPFGHRRGTPIRLWCRL